MERENSSLGLGLLLFAISSTMSLYSVVKFGNKVLKQRRLVSSQPTLQKSYEETLNQMFSINLMQVSCCSDGTIHT